MRNLRKVALAGATAVALTFGTTTVAVAKDIDFGSSSPSGSSNFEVVVTGSSQNTDTVPAIGDDGRETEGKGGSSTRIGRALGAYDQDGLNGVDGRALFGSSKEGEDGATFSSQPFLAQALYATTIFLGITAAASLAATPVYYFLKNNFPNLLPF